jgi:hypothetical protein
MTKKLLAFVLSAPAIALIACLPARTAQAASISTKPVTIGPYSHMIMVVGPLTKEDWPTFQSLAEAAPQDTLVGFASPGGLLSTGISMGELIWKKGFGTFVAAGDEADFGCMSSCALAWLGGRPRMAMQNARIGFHAAYSKDGTEKGTANAFLGIYLHELGMRASAIAFMTMAGPREMKWLTEEAATRIGVAVVWKDGSDQQIQIARPAPAPPAPPSVQPIHPNKLDEEVVLNFVHAHRLRWMAAIDPRGRMAVDWLKMREFYADRVVYQGRR